MINWRQLIKKHVGFDVGGRDGHYIWRTAGRIIGNAILFYELSHASILLLQVGIIQN